MRFCMAQRILDSVKCQILDQFLACIIQFSNMAIHHIRIFDQKDLIFLCKTSSVDREQFPLILILFRIKFFRLFIAFVWSIIRMLKGSISYCPHDCICNYPVNEIINIRWKVKLLLFTIHIGSFL